MKHLAATVLLAWVTLAAAQSWTFAAIGDTPYSDFERAELPKLITAIADTGADFIVHIGDFKHGQDRCDDAVFADRHQLFDASRVPFVFVPGDNEWTDCARLSNGAYQPEERLARLRSLFWSDGRSLGQRTLALERQSADFPEHARFRRGALLFLSLNVPGGDNHMGTADPPRPEYTRRSAAIADWLRQGFALARRDKLRGVVILMQANPGFPEFNRGIPRRGFASLLRTIRAETAAFAGQVLLIHGDSHHQQVDKPLRDTAGKPLANLTRLETYVYPFLGWVKVGIDERDPTLFRFEPQPWPPRTIP